MDQKFSFDRTYLEYYQDRLERASDGTRVPGLGVTAALIERMRIQRGDRVLDVGCSFGRLLPLLLPLTDRVFGLEISYDVVDVAAGRDYHCVVRGTAEESNLPSKYFSHLVLFGVFDCCNQWLALREIARLLKPGGSALITGKNCNYKDEDRLALTAERNAWRKGFPNSFTHAAELDVPIMGLGLRIEEMLRFERRGDFGEMRVLEGPPSAPFYEFAALLRATDTSPAAQDEAPPANVSSSVSRTARRVAQACGYTSVEEFFLSNSLDV